MRWWGEGQCLEQTIRAYVIRRCSSFSEVVQTVSQLQDQNRRKYAFKISISWWEMLITETLYLNNSEETKYLPLNIFVIYFDFSGIHGRCWRHALILFLILPPGGPSHMEATNSNFSVKWPQFRHLKQHPFFSSEIGDKYFFYIAFVGVRGCLDLTPICVV